MDLSSYASDEEAAVDDADALAQEIAAAEAALAAAEARALEQEIAEGGAGQEAEGEPDEFDEYSALDPSGAASAYGFEVAEEEEPEEQQLQEEEAAPECPNEAAPDEPKELELHTGATVRLHGLKGAAHLNGLTGELVALDAATGRWKVRLPPPPGPAVPGRSGEVKALKPDNLECISPSKNYQAETSSASANGRPPASHAPKQTKKPANLEPGATVELHSLKGAAHLNGLKGKLLSHDATTDRWKVRLDKGEVKALRADNLRRVADGDQPASSTSKAASATDSVGSQAATSASTAQSKADDLYPGAWVKLEGLKAAAHLNGLRGQLLSFDNSSGRWQVKLEEEGVKALKANCLFYDKEYTEAQAEGDDDDEGEEEGEEEDDGNEMNADVDPEFAEMDVEELSAAVIEAELNGDIERAAKLQAALAAKTADGAGARANQLNQIQIEVPRELVGRVIGKGGETIKSITEETGARLKMNTCDEVPESLPVLVINGSMDAIKEAKRQVEVLLGIESEDREGAAGKGPGVCKWYAAGFCKHGSRGDCRNGTHKSKDGHDAENGWLAQGPKPGSCPPPKGRLLLLLDLEGGGNQSGEFGEDEIIEVPVLAMCAKTYQELGRFHHFARPGAWDRDAAVMRQRFKPLCFNRESTALPFPQVIANMRKYIATVLHKSENQVQKDDFLFVTCGNWDVKTIIPQQCNKPYPGAVDVETQKLLFHRWCNLKDAFRIFYGLEKSKAPTGMRGMLNRLRIKLVGQHHLGMDDVSNLAEIMKVMLSKGCVLEPTGHATQVPGKGLPKGKGGKGVAGGKGNGKMPGGPMPGGPLFFPGQADAPTGSTESSAPQQPADGGKAAGKSKGKILRGKNKTEFKGFSQEGAANATRSKEDWGRGNISFVASSDSNANGVTASTQQTAPGFVAVPPPSEAKKRPAAPTSEGPPPKKAGSAADRLSSAAERLRNRLGGPKGSISKKAGAPPPAAKAGLKDFLSNLPVPGQAEEDSDDENTAEPNKDKATEKNKATNKTESILSSLPAPKASSEDTSNGKKETEGFLSGIFGKRSASGGSGLGSLLAGLPPPKCAKVDDES